MMHRAHILLPAQLGGLLVVLLALMTGTGPARAGGHPHETADCSACHFGAAAPREETCTACHGTTTHAAGQDAAGGCLHCHNFHTPRQVTTAVGVIDLQAAAATNRQHCQACHDPRGRLADLSPAHRTAARLYHENMADLVGTRPSDTCLRCHGDNGATSWQDEPAGRALSFNEHASHPYGVRVQPGAGDGSNWIAREIDPRLPLFDGRMECQTCHLLTAGTDDLMVPFPTKYDLCKGCHRHHGDEDAGTEFYAAMERR